MDVKLQPTNSVIESLGISGVGFYMPDVLPVTKPTLSKHLNTKQWYTHSH